MSQAGETITKRQQYWLDHIHAASASGSTLVEYAGAHDLEVRQLYQWKRRLRHRGLLPGTSRASAFVPVTAPFGGAASPCSITLPNGVRIQFGREVDRGWLRELLSAASAVS